MNLYYVQVNAPSSLDPFFKVTSYGVALFFIVSAFTLYLSMDSKRHEKNKNIKFYIRRFFRIAPLFYFMLAVSVLASATLRTRPTSISDILMNILFIFNFFQPQFLSIVSGGWTIGVEMLFYLWLPLIFIAVTSPGGSLAFLAGAVMLYRLSVMLFPDIVSVYNLMSFYSQLPVFAMGIVSYFVFKHHIHAVTGHRRIAASLLLLLISSGILYLASTQIIPDILQELQIPSHWWQGLAFSLLLLSLSLFPNGLVVNRITRFYGKISYSFYLVHPLLLESMTPAYWRIIHSPLPIMVSIGLCLVLSVLVVTPVAMLTYRFIESPGMGYGKKIIGRM